MNKSRLDRMGLQFDDLVVGVLYGEKGSLSAFYKAIDAHYPVLCGSDFGCISLVMKLFIIA